MDIARAPDLPPIALSVRQPWAWAIVAGHKVIENRSAGSIRAGRMVPGPVAVHAATAMTRSEYDWAVWRLARHGVTCPRPEVLVRRAIIGAVKVTEIVDRSYSEWFGGPMGLGLEDAVQCDPVAAPGALGYFEWSEEGHPAEPAPWMLAWDRPGGDSETGDLFGETKPSFRTPPKKPWSV